MKATSPDLAIEGSLGSLSKIARPEARQDFPRKFRLAVFQGGVSRIMMAGAKGLFGRLMGAMCYHSNARKEEWYACMAFTRWWLYKESFFQIERSSRLYGRAGSSAELLLTCCC